MDDKKEELYEPAQLVDEASEEAPERPNYEQELISIIGSNLSDAELKDRLDDYHENDIADVLDDLTPQQRRRLYRVVGLDTVSDIFSYLEDVGKYIEELDAEKAADIIENMDEIGRAHV